MDNRRGLAAKKPKRESVKSMKKKICVLGAQVPFVRGGAELMVESLTSELKKRGYDAELVQLPFKWYPNETLLDSCLAWRMIDLSESNGQKIDLVIGTKFPTYLVRSENKVLWLMHQFRAAYDLYDSAPYAGLGTLPGGPLLKQRIEIMDNTFIPEAKKLYAISQNVCNRLAQHNHIAAEALYHPPKHVGHYFTEEYGDYILSIGRLEVLKRVEELIRALQFCDPKIKAYIGGNGPERQHLEELTHELGLEDRVKFLGFVSDEDLLKLYANAFAVYFAPVDEDYGYITLEALLSKKPLITTWDAGGVLEFVEQEVNGLISKPQAEELGKNINALYQNKNRCKKMGEAGYEKVKDISWDHVIDLLTETLR